MNNRLLSHFSRLLLAFVLVIGFVGCAPAGGSVQWYVSLSGNDANNCLSSTTPCLHIATAIQRAKSDDAIHLAAGTYVENLLVGKSLTLIGAGPDQSIIDGSDGASTFTSTLTIDGTNVSGLSVNLEELAIKNGTAHAGGGIHADNASFLLLKDVLVSDNTWVTDNLPNQYGAGIYFMSDAYQAPAAKLNLLNSTVRDNQGDGIMVWGHSDLDLDTSTVSQNDGNGVGYGGDDTASIFMTTIHDNRGSGLEVVYPEGNVTVKYSLIDGNHGFYVGGISNSGDLTLLQSTISNNTGGVGGGLFNEYRVIADNVTFSGNSVVPYTYYDYPDNGSGGAIYNYTQPGQVGWFDATNLTIAYNSAAIQGGGIYTYGSMPSTIQDSLLAFNTGGNCAFASPPSSVITDMSTDDTCQGFIVVADPLIAPLAGNGGYTVTHALLTGSLAIDAATGGGGTPLTDQRDVTRPLDGDGDGTARNDVGAYEFDPAAPPPALASVSGVVWNDQCFVAPDVDPIPSPLPVGCVQDAYGVDADGLRQAAESGLPGVMVAIGLGDCPMGQQSAQVATDANGNYTISGLLSGQYCLEVGPLTSNGHWTLVPGGQQGKTYRSVQLNSGQTLNGQDFAWYQQPAFQNFIPDINPVCHSAPQQLAGQVSVAMQGNTYLIDGRNMDGTWLRIMITPDVGCWVLAETGTASGDISNLRVIAVGTTITVVPPEPQEVDCTQYTTYSTCSAVTVCAWTRLAGGDGLCSNK